MQTWRECWDNSKQSTTEHVYPKRLLVRAGHTILTRLLSANPHGYPNPGRDGRGRIITPRYFGTDALEATVSTSDLSEALEMPKDLLSQPTENPDITETE